MQYVREMAEEVRSAKKWWVRPVVWMALPFTARWVREQERRILRNGRPLNETEIEYARRTGIPCPECVRLLVLPEIPTPADGFLGTLARLFRFPLFAASGMALGHGIYLADEVAGNRTILVHELVHVSQYERLGGIRRFLKDYLDQCLTDGYENAELEREANETAARICGFG